MIAVIPVYSFNVTLPNTAVYDITCDSSVITCDDSLTIDWLTKPFNIFSVIMPFFEAFSQTVDSSLITADNLITIDTI